MTRAAVLVLAATAASAQPCPTDCPDWVDRSSGCCPLTPVTPRTPGTLSVKCNRADASVRVDDAEPTAVPLTRRAVAPSVHHVVVTAPGVARWSRQVLVRPGERVELTAVLCAPGQTERAEGCVGTPVSCLPGQRWDLELDRCAGTPSSCPEGQVMIFQRCVPRAESWDSDQDGMPESLDQCWDRAEDVDGFKDDDGCPDPDNDGDGVLDKADRCPLDAEDPDGFEDQDGCPEPDNDRDGFLDGVDQCPVAAEDVDGFQDEDGCPDPDNDGDGVLDKADQCQGPKETVNNFDDGDGCPDTVPPLFDVIVKRPLTMRYGLSVTSVTPGWGPVGGPRGPGGGGLHPGLLVSATVETWLGIEAGLEGTWPVEGIGPGIGSFVVGAAPVRWGFWLGDYGELGLVLAEPFVHVVLSPGLWTPSVVIGNRFSLRGKTSGSLLIAFESGRAGLDPGFRVGLELEPELAAEGSFFRRGFSVGVAIAGAIGFTKEGTPPQLSASAQLIAAWHGLGLGLQVHTFSLLVPVVDLAPFRFGHTDDKDQWGMYFEPFAQFRWYGFGSGTGTVIGGRLGLIRTGLPGDPTFVMAQGLELGPGLYNMVFDTSFGLRWEMNR